MTTRIPTQRNISALLAKAGFTKSVSTPGRIRGVRNHSDGYAVQGAYEGVVWVRHETFHVPRFPEDLSRIAEVLAAYEADIVAAGFAVQRTSDRLIVTTRPEEA